MVAWALVGLAGDVPQLVVPVEVHLVGRAAQVCARAQLLGDVGHTCGRQQRDEPVGVADDAV